MLDEDVEESHTSQSHLAKKQKKKKHHHSEDEDDDRRTKKSKVLDCSCINFIPAHCFPHKRSQEKEKVLILNKDMARKVLCKIQLL